MAQNMMLLAQVVESTHSLTYGSSQRNWKSLKLWLIALIPAFILGFAFLRQLGFSFLSL